jgi:KUP system potassium uptake protein
MSKPTNVAVDPGEHGEHTSHAPSGGQIALAFGALGVVFGDIGTSPLYAMKETVKHNELAITQASSFGLASLAFWALIIIISVKYLMFVMRADQNGEGGILALTSLLIGDKAPRERTARWTLILIGLFGTALLYGDGIITPAISVLSAVEGFKQASDVFEDWVIPIALVILVLLFAVQRKGTGAIGKAFGPIMLVWFAVLAILGVTQIAESPEVLKAINPQYAIEFFQIGGWKPFLALGSLFLVVTGGEALYADMGHFGRKPIALAWVFIAFPALVLNYFGQAALLLREPEAIENPLFFMGPEWTIWPLAILATCATVIASQALISGVFSLTVQAVRMDYLPRLSIKHTSADHAGQVYVPIANWLLMVACLACVLFFQTSSNLAAAYGIAVTSTMVATTILMYAIVKRKGGWSTPKAAAITAPLLVIDVAFLGANIPKIPDGGWFPLVVGVAQFTLMTTWHKGRQLVAARIHRGESPLDEFLAEIEMTPPKRVNGSGIFLFKGTGAVPPALLMNLKHNKVLHANVVILNVDIADRANVDPSERASVSARGYGIFEASMKFGYLDDPDLHANLSLLQHPQLKLDPDELTYFLGRETVTSSEHKGMAAWREEIFALQSRTATSAARFFDLPPAQVVEVGAQVEI